MKNSKGLVVAVDLGGTKTLVALVDGSNQIIVKDYSVTHANEGPKLVVQEMCQAVDRVLAQRGRLLPEVQSLAIAAAGAIDTKNGMVTFSPNLPGWRDIPLVAMLRERYPLDVYLIHDASAAAVAEHCLGAGKGTRHMIYLTVSTGIGGGIIINGKLYQGTAGAAGEIGHMVIDYRGPKCNCGNYGCLEVLASGPALARDAAKWIQAGRKSILSEMVHGKLDELTARDVGNAARQGDKVALAAIRQIAEYLGVALTNLVNIFNPEMIVVGGGVSNLGELLLRSVRQVVKERGFPFAVSNVRIIKALLGDNVGVLGAAVWARRAI